MAETPKVQIKGLMRFSYLSQNGFAKSVSNLDERRAVLYDPERLKRRFHWFERLAFHTLALQDDADFTTALLIAECFPDTWRARLEGIVADCPQFRIVSLPPMVHIQAVKAAYNALPDDPTASHIATFRQDDDDGLHRSATARIRAVADSMLPVREDRKPFVIAFNRGLYFEPASSTTITEWYERAPLGIGLAMVTPKGDHATVFRRNHRNLVEYYDCYTEIGRPMWIRSVHEDNDSSASPQGRAGALRPKGVKRVLWDGFGLTPEMLEGPE